MRLLLDTHTLLWWLNDDEKLGSRARGLIGDPANDVLVSAVSLWEITVKLRIGKLDADIEEILGILPGQGFQRLDISDAHLVALAGLPVHHRDPFDHLLLAQALAGMRISFPKIRTCPSTVFHSSPARTLRPDQFHGNTIGRFSKTFMMKIATAFAGARTSSRHVSRLD